VELFNCFCFKGFGYKLYLGRGLAIEFALYATGVALRIFGGK